MKKNGLEVVVVGCGVIGLTCGIRLLEHFPVKIIAHQIPPQTTSDVAGAFWEPYKAFPIDRVLGWAKISLEEFYRLSKIPETGVSITTMLQACEEPTEAPWWMDVPKSARPALMSELPPGHVCGFVFTVPKMETPLYMPYLLKRFEQDGGVVAQVEQPLDLAELYKDNRVIINCTGLGARTFCQDSGVYPLRGQVIRVRAPAIKFIHDSFGAIGPTYVVPRQDDCVLGGTLEANDWNIEPDPAIAEDILRRCKKLAPALGDCQILGHSVGLRPGRDQVRLEHEPINDRCAVIHNYGHGGGGFTLSWGCAEEVLALVDAFADKLT
jgi:D-amino-acid oxidase